MKLSYHARRRLKKGLTVLGYTALIGVLVWTCWVAWLARFVTYTSDGVRLDFDRDYRIQSGELAQDPENATVAIHYNEGEEVVNNSTELTQITGYYVTTAMLRESVEDVATAIRSLPKGTAIMLDLKSGYGNFYYSTEIADAPVSDQIDSEAVDELIRTLSKSDYYLIARIPAFRDRAYGLSNTEYGLPIEGGYLWYDSDNCYWLNPSSSGTRFYLGAIVTELRSLGFDEVVFTDFRFPDTSEIIWQSDISREQALFETAQELVSDYTTSQFAVSFATDDITFSLPEGRTRLYLTGVSADNAQGTLDSSTVPNPETQLVFLTEAKDTRYDITSVLRPLPIVAGGE